MATEAKPKMSKKALEQKRASIEAAVRKKRECEKKALEVVEYLVENAATSSNWLLENSRHINPQYYDDVTEERAITKICGFPLCCHPLSKVQNKKFAISTKTNKVYDITERKKFCSDRCFSSSRYFKDQLPTSPLWMRDDEKLPVIEIPAILKSAPGDEVLITSVEIPEEDKEENKDGNGQDESNIKAQQKKEIQEKDTSFRPHPFDVVFKSLRQWFCARTLDWLENTEDLSDDEQIDEMNEKMAELKVNQALKEERPPVEYKPAISYDALKRDEKNANLKVRAFLSGRWEYASEEGEEENETEEPNEGGDAVVVPIVMPLANLSAQKALRRKVVLDYLEKWFVGLSTSTNLKLRQFQQDLHSLVYTFDLTADTVTFRPDEIPILGVTILLILGKKNLAVRNSMQDPNQQEKFSKILNPYGCSLQILEEFLEDLVQRCQSGSA